MDFYDKLLRSDGFIRFKPVQAMQYKYFSDWRLIALREIIELSDFEESIEFVSEKLQMPNLSQNLLKELLGILFEIRLIERDPSGKIKTTNTNISIPDGHNDEFIFAYHGAMIEKAKWALMNVDWRKRNISTVTMAVDVSKIAEINSYIEAVRKEFVGKFSSQNSNSAAIYNFQIQLFPLCGDEKSEPNILDVKTEKVA